MAPWHHRQVICWNRRESDSSHLCLLSPQRETWTFKEWELKRYRFCSLCGHGVTFLSETILCHHHIWHQTNLNFRRRIIAGFKEAFTTRQVTCKPQHGISKEWSMQVHSTCYKFVSHWPDYYDRSHEAHEWDAPRFLSHEQSTNKTDVACLMEINLHNLKHIWSERDFQNDNVPQKAVSSSKMNCNNSSCCWLICLKSASFNSEPYHAAMNSSQLCAEEEFLKLLEFPLTLVIISSNLLFLCLSLHIYEIYKICKHFQNMSWKEIRFEEVLSSGFV